MRPSRNTIMIVVYGRHVEIDWHFPARWEICFGCEGHGTTTRHIECDGSGFTGSEWAEACDADPGDDGEPGFAEKYFGGHYDEPCPDCKGLGRVQVIDEELVTGWRDKIALKAHHKNQREFAEIEAIHAAERRMGA